jgi:hypothetical protein
MSNPVKQFIRQARQQKTLRHWGLKAYKLKHPVPYKRPNMEFDFDIWNGISSLHGQDGRQIGENNTGPYPYKEDIATEHRPFKFGGSREGLPMNMTALKHVLAVWDDALQLATLVRNQYIAHRQLPSPRFNLLNAYLFSKLGTALPAYLVRRKEQPLQDGDLPPLETAFFTLGVGPFMVLRALMEKGELSPLNPEPMSADQLYEAADSSGSLVTQAGKGCAGSPKLIRQFLDVTMNGTYDKPLDSANAQRALASVGDWNRFYDYVLAASRLELLIKLNQALCAQALLALQANSSITTASTQAAMQAALEQCYFKVVKDGDDHLIVANTLQVLSALINDHGDPGTLATLRTAGLLSLPAEGALSPAEAARRIRLANTLLYPACQRDLATLHDKLGRPAWGQVGETDLLRRTGGPALAGLLNTLEAQAVPPAHVAAAA